MSLLIDQMLRLNEKSLFVCQISNSSDKVYLR